MWHLLFVVAGEHFLALGDDLLELGLALHRFVVPAGQVRVLRLVNELFL